jgi:hypothetical protein
MSFTSDGPPCGRARRGRTWRWGIVALVVASVMATSTSAFAEDDGDPEPPPPPPPPPPRAPPTAPSYPSVIRQSVGEVVLRFVDRSTTETKFVIERKPTLEGTYEQVKTIVDHSSGQPARTGKSFEVTLVKLGPIDCYRVLAYRGSRSSASVPTCLGPTTRASFSFTLQKPWNLQDSDRYAYNAATNTHITWVFSTDQPHAKGSPTRPRTEMRWNRFSTGKQMWEADVLIPSGTAGPSTIMQVKHRDDEIDPTWSYALRFHDANGGTFRNHDSGADLQTGVYNRWWNVKAVNDADSGWTHLYINDRLVDKAHVVYNGDRNFKNGVYGGAGQTTAHFRDIRHFV